MYSDVERLQGTLRDLGGLVNEPDTLPDVTRDYIAVRQEYEYTYVQYYSGIGFVIFIATCVYANIHVGD